MGRLDRVERVRGRADAMRKEGLMGVSRKGYGGGVSGICLEGLGKGEGADVRQSR